MASRKFEGMAPGYAPLDAQPWLVHVSSADRRTMTAAALRAAVQGGSLTPQTLVWRAGMNAWAPVESIAELMLPSEYPPAPPPSALGWDAPLAPNPGPRLGDTTTYAAWDPPQGRQPQGPASHGHSPHGRPASVRPTELPADLMRELFATGVIVLGIVMFTLYVISLGGVFQPGSRAHDAAAAQHAQ